MFSLWYYPVMKIKKIFLIILISLIAIGGIIYFLPKKSENTNSAEITEYTTYFVEKYNFSIEYPKGYFLMLDLGDPHMPPLENELLATINFSSHSLTETEGRYNNGLSQFPDDYKNISVKVFYTKDGYDFKFEPFQVTYEKSFESIVEHVKNSISKNTTLDPQNILKQYYNDVMRNPFNKDFVTDNFVNKQKEIQKEIDERCAQNGICMPYNIFLCAQDYPDDFSKIIFKESYQTENTLKFEVYIFPEVTTPSIVTLIKDVDWKIDDIDCNR